MNADGCTDLGSSRHCEAWPPTLSSCGFKHVRFPNHLKVAHACTSAFQNIICYSVPDVAERERMGSQGDQDCVLLGFLLNLPRASIFLFLFFFIFFLVGFFVCFLVKWARLFLPYWVVMLINVVHDTKHSVSLSPHPQLHHPDH